MDSNAIFAIGLLIEKLAWRCTWNSCMRAKSHLIAMIAERNSSAKRTWCVTKVCTIHRSERVSFRVMLLQTVAVLHNPFSFSRSPLPDLQQGFLHQGFAASSFADPHTRKCLRWFWFCLESFISNNLCLLFRSHHVPATHVAEHSFDMTAIFDTFVANIRTSWIRFWPRLLTLSSVPWKEVIILILLHCYEIRLY